MLASSASAVAAAIAMSGSQVQADDPNSAPNPYHVVEHWAKLPEGRVWGMAIGVDIDRDGTSLWVFDRCGGKTCDGSNVAPIQKFDATRQAGASFGAGLFNWPHGLVADTRRQCLGHRRPSRQRQRRNRDQVRPDGKVLMTLGKPGVAGNGPTSSTGPSDVLVAPNGDIFVADGHGEQAPTTASSNSPRTANSSKPGAITARRRANSTCRTGSPWIPPAGCTSPTAPTTASRFSIRRQVPRRMEAVRPAERRLHPRRHPLCRRLAIERQGQRAVPAGHPHRQRQGRQGDGLHRRDRTRRRKCRKASPSTRTATCSAASPPTPTSRNTSRIKRVRPRARSKTGSGCSRLTPPVCIRAVRAGRRPCASY